MKTVCAGLSGRELLEAARDLVVAWPNVSPSRERQVRWVAGEFARALEHAEHPLAPKDATVRTVFRAASVLVYLHLARRGELRVRRAANPAKGSDNSTQTRVEVLGMLVSACGAEAWAELPAQGDPPPKDPVAPRPRTLLRNSLERAADQARPTPGQVRMLAIGALVADTAARSGELCPMTVQDLAPTLEEVRVVRRPQGWSPDRWHVESVPLSPLARAAMRRWLSERQALLYKVEGTATAVWVTLHPNHNAGRVTPPGIPLQPRGLARAWKRAVMEVNDQLAGEPSWTPLPTRMEQVRRGVEVTTARPQPFAPDAQWAAERLDAVTRAAERLAAVRRDTPGAVEELAAREAVRCETMNAWAGGIEHQVLLAGLEDAGLSAPADMAAAGYEPVLLDALDRAVGWRSRRVVTA